MNNVISHTTSNGQEGDYMKHIIVNADTIISEYQKLHDGEILNLEYKTGDRVEIRKNSVRFAHSGLFFMDNLENMDGRLYLSRDGYLLGQIRNLNEIVEIYNSIPAVGLAECGLGVKI